MYIVMQMTTLHDYVHNYLYSCTSHNSIPNETNEHFDSYVAWPKRKPSSLTVFLLKKPTVFLLKKNIFGHKEICSSNNLSAT